MLHTGSQETGNREGRSVLHVLFLAGGNGLAAKLAADWTRLLADGCMEVEAADPDGVDSTAAFACAPAGLAVVIHAPGCSGPCWPVAMRATNSAMHVTAKTLRWRDHRL